MWNRPGPDGLTKKQAIFVEKFALNFAKTGKEEWGKSVREAGYSENSVNNTVYELKRNEKIRAALRERLKEAAKRCDISVEFCLQKFLEVYYRAMQIVPVVDKLGNPIGVFRFDGRTANRSMEMVAKISGVYEEGLTIKDDSYAKGLKEVFAKAAEEAKKKGAYEADKDPDLLAHVAQMTEKKVIRVKDSEVYDPTAEKPETIFDDLDKDDEG